MPLPEPPPLEIAPGDLAKLRAGVAPHAVLDVRELWEIEVAAFPEAIHVPLAALPASLADLPGDRTLVVVCHHGQRSWLATRLLREQGFAHATNLAGGIDAWAMSVDPSMPRY